MTTSDLARVSFIIFTAFFVDKNKKYLKDWKFLLTRFTPFLGITLILILFQPDTSTTIIISAIIMVMLFIAGTNWRRLKRRRGEGRGCDLREQLPQGGLSAHPRTSPEAERRQAGGAFPHPHFTHGPGVSGLRDFPRCPQAVLQFSQKGICRRFAQTLFSLLDGKAVRRGGQPLDGSVLPRAFFGRGKRTFGFGAAGPGPQGIRPAAGKSLARASQKQPSLLFFCS